MNTLVPLIVIPVKVELPSSLKWRNYYAYKEAL